MIEMKWKDVRNGPMYTEPVPVICPVEERNAYIPCILKNHIHISRNSYMTFRYGQNGMYHREYTA